VFLTGPVKQLLFEPIDIFLKDPNKQNCKKRDKISFLAKFLRKTADKTVYERKYDSISPNLPKSFLIKISTKNWRFLDLTNDE
jgi:hypothetical protein